VRFIPAKLSGKTAFISSLVNGVLLCKSLCFFSQSSAAFAALLRFLKPPTASESPGDPSFPSSEDLFPPQESISKPIKIKIEKCFRLID
jgi:hypothetical protein